MLYLDMLQLEQSEGPDEYVQKHPALLHQLANTVTACVI
jgi:hypothetical protein